MKGAPSVWARVRRLEANRGTRHRPASWGPELHRAVDEVAAERGLDPADVLAEAVAIAERCDAASATTSRGVVAFLAAETGEDPAALWAELAPGLGEEGAWAG